MSEIVDITVGVIQEEITISAVNNIGEITVNAVNNSEEINVTANTNLIQININTAPVSVINPQNYDLSQFTNTSPNPFVQQSTLSSYVPISRTLTINSTTLDLSADRSWTISTNWGSIGGSLSSQGDLVAALAAKQDTLTLTTTGSSGAATLVGATLNIPNYTISGLGGVPSSRTLTINGTTQDLSANRTFTIPTDLTIGTTPIASGTTGRVLFQGTGNVLQQSSSLFWDGTNNRLGIGTSSPTTIVHINGNAAGSEPSLQIRQQANTTPTWFAVRNTDNLAATGAVSLDLGISGGTGQFFTGTAQGDIVLKAYSNPSTSKFFLGTGNTAQMVLFPSTNNIGINTTTDAGFRLDVNGTARVQGALTIANTGNTIGLIMSNFYTTGAVQITNNNPRGFITTINGNADAGYLAVSNLANFQGIAFQYNYFRAGNALNITNPIAGSEVNGFYFNPTVSGQGASSIFGFRSSLASAANRWNLYFDGTASNYLAGNLLINTTTDAGFRLDVNGTARVQTSAYFATTSGNVGIGTSTPFQKLVVSNAAGGATTTFTNTTDADLQILLTSGVSLISPTTNTLAFGTTTTERMRLTSSGTLLVGATSNNTSSDISTTAQLIATRGTIKYPLTLSTAGTPISGDQIRMSFNYGSGFSATAYMGSLLENASTAATSLIFGTYASSLAEKMRLTSAGNLLLNTTTDVASSKLTIESTTQGFLPPRMTTTQRNAIASPAAGLVVYDTTLSALSSFNGTVWSTIGGSVAWGSITGTLSTQTDLQSALDAKVPYTGATNNVNLGEYGLTAGQLTLDITPTGTAAVGTTRWNDAIGSSETTLKGGNVTLKNGVDLVARVVNKVTPNTTLTKAGYAAVRVSGAQGQRLAVAYAQADSDANSADTLGLVTETIATNQEGFIITVGQLDGINTTGSLQGETWSDGDVLYLSPTTPGALTNIKPNGLTGHIVVIGYVEYAHAINGKIYVKIMNGWELDELHNVYIDPLTLANNDTLKYDAIAGLWKNASGGGGGGSIIKLASQTLAVGSWTLVSGYYQLTFSNVNITTNTRVDFTPANASYTEVTTCGMLPQVDVAAGSCTFYSLFPPQSNILGEITIFPTI